MTTSRKTRVRAERVRRDLVSVDDAAEYLGVNPRTIRRRIADGSLTGYRLGKRILRVDLDELDALMQPVGDH